MNLAHELEALGAIGAEGAQERLADADTRQRLRARVARGKRRANFTIALGIAAVLGVSASIGATPHDATYTALPSPSPSETAPARRGLPPLDSAEYLVHLRGAYATEEALTCDLIPEVPMATEGIEYPGSMPLLPTWIEANRIYGLPDGLPASYPIPLYSRDGANFYDVAVIEIASLYPSDVEMVAALIAPDGSWWGFDVDYSVIDAMPFDPPGLFVTLTPNPDCQGGPRAGDRSRIPTGHYDVRVMVVRDDERRPNVISDHGDIAIVAGLPSVPSLNVTQ